MSGVDPVSQGVDPVCRVLALCVGCWPCVSGVGPVCQGVDPVSGCSSKLRWVLTNRLLKFFLERAKKDPAKYLKFYEDYGLFFREGIVTTPEQEMRVRADTLPLTFT